MPNLISHHIAVKSRDVAAAKAFYTDVLGFDIVGQIPGSEIYFIDIGGTTIELMGGEGETEAPKTGIVHMAYWVEDVDATYEELVAQGVHFTVEPKTVKDIRLAFFNDPDGNVLELFNSPTLRFK